MPSPNTVDFGPDLTDQQLFDEATSPAPVPEAEPTAPPPETPAEAPAPVETTGGRLKDPVTGKFVAKEQAAPQAPLEAPSEAQAPQEPETEPQMPASVPSWRLAEEAQRRREAEAQNYAAMQQLRQMQMQMAQWQEQQQAAQQQQEIDPVTDPGMYQQMLQGAMQKEIANIRLESNLQIAQFKHGETFDKAYEAFVENSYAGDQASYLSVMRSPNPGEAIVRWYNTRETMNRVGPDPEAFIQAEIDRRMNDPTFQAEVIKRFQAANNGNTPSVSQVRFPPSLSRVSSAAPAAEGEMDASDAAMYQFATTSKR